MHCIPDRPLEFPKEPAMHDLVAVLAALITGGALIVAAWVGNRYKRDDEKK
jgi:hypothetical protein